ncbi:hypothetical protein PHYPSEUDO_010454 [Phytophthora pseudosyringae]|uniref:RxLR effector protein n=1 Tax=Phytophthora pseudosyringae TaxID=221518 RepID=A0A8T1VA41_9STRA|nr:hypothetical protein PHYPSEUDO_010454 [Phytophthora pseudosyringae]
MKVVAIALLASAAAFAGASAEGATNPMHRDLRIETSDTNDAVEADLRDDELGVNEDFWGSWEDHYAAHPDPLTPNEPCSNETNSASGNDEHGPDVGALPAAAKGALQQAESVVTAALPFNVEHAKSLLLPVGLVVVALLVIAVVAVLVGVRRQQLSEPMFGPVELASDLPVPMTTSAASGDESDTDHADDIGGNDEADTGATILAGEEEEEEKEEEGGDLAAALA